MCVSLRYLQGQGQTESALMVKVRYKDDSKGTREQIIIMSHRVGSLGRIAEKRIYTFIMGHPTNIHNLLHVEHLSACHLCWQHAQYVV